MSTFTGYAQDGPLGTLKIAFISKKLNLTPEEAQRFWPIYNQYIEELRQARVKGGRTEIEVEEDILNVRKKYSNEFTKAISPDKVNAFFRSEKEFNIFVQKEIERRQLKMQQRRSMIRP
ncbi:MAG: hypothetical protein C5B59_20955 [Bacteroidetes bacterium]|nr:MAG: hypothetical protein C5B59_20955 [Bacteroidota bacterium]